MEAVRYKWVDADYRNHLQAYLNFAAQAKKSAGKGRERPVYSRFIKFYDYEKQIDKIKNGRKGRSKLSGLSRFLKKGD